MILMTMTRSRNEYQMANGWVHWLDDSSVKRFSGGTFKRKSRIIEKKMKDKPSFLMFDK